MSIKWLGTTLNMNGKRIDLPENINIPLWYKVKVRALLAHKNVKIQHYDKTGKHLVCPQK